MTVLLYMRGIVKRYPGILLISSDLPELLGICHRITVLCEGRITGRTDRDDVTQEQIMTLATTIS